MKNKQKILIIILLIITICGLGHIFIRIMNTTIRGVIIKVNDKSIVFMDINDERLYSISMPETNTLRFKQYQEILVSLKYYAFLEESNPMSIKAEDIKKISILKEKSNIEIPTKKLEKVYSSNEKVLITINELSSTGLSITINDTNEFKHEYKYSNYYQILKKCDSTYSELVRDTKIKTTVNSTTKENSDTIINTYNWENVYGKLESGNYQFKTSTSDYYMNIFIKFTIDENGKITYSKPECGLIF